jgi:hypothetical protein
MATLAEKIAEAKKCCRETINRKVEETRQFYDKFFGGKWKEFVIKRDESTGKLIGKKVGCAGCPVQL